MKKVLFSILLALTLIQPGFSAEKTKDDDRNGGILYGDDYCYLIAAPTGWVMDTKSGEPDGLQVVFYKKGQTWKDADTMMYINTTTRNKGETKDNIIKFDIESFKKNSPAIIVKDAPDFKMDNKEKIVIKYFTGDKWGNYEAVGYYDDKKAVIMFIMSSRSEKSFKENLPKFMELLKNYVPMDYVIEKEKKEPAK